MGLEFQLSSSMKASGGDSLGLFVPIGVSDVVILSQTVFFGVGCFLVFFFHLFVIVVGFWTIPDSVQVLLLVCAQELLLGSDGTVWDP